MEEIDLSKNTLLTEIWLTGNELTKLDLSNNKQIGDLKLVDGKIENPFVNQTINETASRYNNMIECIIQAYNKVNQNRIEKVPFPEIYIDMPHMSCRIVESIEEIEEGVYDNMGGNQIVNTKSEALQREEDISEFYTRIGEIIYNKVEEEYGHVLTGMGFGREDPDGMYRQYNYAWGNGIHNFNESDNAYSLTYKTMQKMATFIHNKGKLFLWVPYSSYNFQWGKIGEIVNTGKDSAGNDLFDVFMMQPGLFYSTFTGVLSDSNTEEISNKQKRLKNSVISDAIVDDYGNVIMGNKTTQTEIAFQIEFDISLVTGRRYTNNVEESPMYPKATARNFLQTLSWYNELIYNDKIPMGFYNGGPNEQDLSNITYDNVNNNKHTIINHPSALSQYNPYIGYYEIGSSNETGGEGLSYNGFFSRIAAGNYNMAWYNNKLLYDIMKGLLFNDWNDSIKNYLGM